MFQMMDFMNFNFYYFVIGAKKKKKYTCNTFSLSLEIVIADVCAKNCIFYEMGMKFKRRFIGEYHKHVEIYSNRLKIKKKKKN